MASNNFKYKMMECKAVSAYDVQTLAERVQPLLNLGYQLAGGIAVAATTVNNGGIRMEYAQALIKPGPLKISQETGPR